MTNIVTKLVKKIHSLFKCGSNCKKESEALKKKVISERRKDVRKIRETNTTLRILLEKGEFQVRILRPVKKGK